ncbi:hypothetical protein BBO99_00002001 [Phytophthora kernoviae]|uniref:Uncharacterized protein n=2 Tax=Phytophthora kernoviae TaxID=325452 RepID=A0A421H438_9STRA|nr:hypothetical protein G195_000868 [Phytophthora kernoviae 00238/432]KAG2532839.1 hypothetical protein JM16_000006 [Phytophthora kernoviae]KAG2533554.1 hypothetical protein JM18_000006 [Phytophthora kernoviae]RLN11092.1 hypothetical protein BBI17_000212 [Phytophthora kernoviae]RLN86152.1 hypothetical protein BBO99_00002001 [Phytophthora kernoviae]
MFLKFPRTFDATETLLPWRLAQCAVFAEFPAWLLTIIYTIGAAGIFLSHITLVNDFGGSKDSLWHKHVLLVTSSIALVCTLIFMATFVAFYQRQLLKLLFNSFDFAFYSFQITSANMCVCTFYNWNPSHCLMALSWSLLAHWAFTLDALTPVMRRMLKFRVGFAAAVVCLLLVDHITIMYRIFIVGDMELQDSVIFEGTVWSQHLVLDRFRTLTCPSQFEES